MDRYYTAGLYFKMIPAEFNVLLGFEPFDLTLRGTHGPEYGEGSQRLEFLTGSYSLKAVIASNSNSPFSKRSIEREEMSIVMATPSTINSEITFPTAGLC